MTKQLPLTAALALCAGAAFAQAGLPAIPTPTHDWGCEVLLCLANPNGPTAAAACVPPIHRLWSHLARGRAFPSCGMATGPNGRSYAVPAYRHYDRCPDGTNELPIGQRAELAAPMASPPASMHPGSTTTYVAGAAGLTYAGTDSGDGFGTARSEGPLPPMVCVGGRRGTREVWQGDSSDFIDVYDRIFVAPAQASPRVIDVYIDNALWHSVRW
jgi:hypothetical protein